MTFLPPLNKLLRWRIAIRKTSLLNTRTNFMSWCWCGAATVCTFSTIGLTALPGDLFYIRAEDKHAYASVNDLVLQNVIYCPDRLSLNVDWAACIPGFNGAKGSPHWRLSSSGMTAIRQAISLLEQESYKIDPLANPMAEILFAQLVMMLKRHRYETDNPSATQQETLLDKLIATLAASLNKSFVLESSASRSSAANVPCVSSSVPRRA